MNKFLLTIFTVVMCLSYICATDITSSFPENITLVDKPVSVELYLYNSSSTTELITLNAFTSPFPSVISENQFRLSPKESKRISIVITPLTDYLEAVYSSSIEVRAFDYSKKINFTILQKTNRICPIDLQYLVQYVHSTDEYKLELMFKNNYNTDKEIEIIGLKDINLSQPIGTIDIEKNSEASTVRLFKTDNEKVILEYRCNGLFDKREIDLPQKTKPTEEIVTGFTGLFTFIGNITFGDFYDTTIFQIILVIILIILVLSFSTRYIKYIYKR